MTDNETARKAKEEAKAFLSKIYPFGKDAHRVADGNLYSYYEIEKSFDVAQKPLIEEINNLKDLIVDKIEKNNKVKEELLHEQNSNLIKLNTIRDADKRIVELEQQLDRMSEVKNLKIAELEVENEKLK